MAKNSPDTEVKQTITTTTTAVLNRWNRWFTGIFIVQGLAFALLASSQLLPVVTSYVTTDPIASDLTGGSVTDLAMVHLFDVNIVHLMAAFFLVTIVTHAVIATVYRSQYEADLKRRVNRLRWVEYAATSGLMLLAISLVTGIADLSTLLAILVVTVASALLGLATELFSQKNKPNWLTYWLAIIAALVPAAIFAIYAWSTNVYGEASIPGFVYGLYGTLVVFGLGFAVNLYRQLTQTGQGKDYLHVERMYMILSLLAKTALVWQIFAGALRP
jgi:hypothetical protein